MRLFVTGLFLSIVMGAVAASAQVKERQSKADPRVTTPNTSTMDNIITAPITSTNNTNSTTSNSTSQQCSCVVNSGQKITKPRVVLKPTDLKDFMWEYVTLPGQDMSVYKTHVKKVKRDGNTSNIGSLWWRVPQCVNGKVGNGKHVKGHNALAKFEGGKIQFDVDGNQDYCLVDAAHIPPGTPNTPCEAGFALHHDTKECIKYGSGTTSTKSHKPKGKWTAFHNTNNFERHTTAGLDYYRKKSNHNTRVTLSCTPGTNVSNADYKTDYEGQTDWCVISTPGSAQVVKPMTCAAPWYRLEKS